MIEMSMFKSSKLDVFPIDISPKIAEQILKANTRQNRRIRHWWVNLLALIILRNEWKLTHQGLGFDVNGDLLDGQHRLLAIQLSGKTVRSLVTVGMDTDAFLGMDQGVLRTTSDVTNIPSDTSQVLNFAAALCFNVGRVTPPLTLAIGAIGLQELAAEMLNVCRTSRRIISSAPVRLAGCLSIMRGESQEFVFGQYRALCNLVFDELTPMSQAFLRQSGNFGTQSGSVVRLNASNRNEILARAIRAFDQKRKFGKVLPMSPEDVSRIVAEVRVFLRESIGDSNYKVEIELPKTTRKVRSVSSGPRTSA